jgi:hypothetical protein
MTSSNQLKVEQTEIPPCLRTAWRQGQKERRHLLDRGEGKKVVSFHGSVVFERAPEEGGNVSGGIAMSRPSKGP